MLRIPTDWPDAFAEYVARSCDNFRVIPKKELAKLQDGHKLLGQVTFDRVQFRTVVNKGSVFVQGIPLDGTTHDLVEEFVLAANSEHQGAKLSPKDLENLVYAARNSIVDATEDVLEGLKPEYLVARMALAKYSPIRVVTSENEMPKDTVVKENLGDIISLSKKVEKASSKPVPPNLDVRFGRSVIRVFGTTAVRYEIPEEERPMQEKGAA